MCIRDRSGPVEVVDEDRGMRGCRVSAVEVEERPNERLDPGDVGGGLFLGLGHPLGGGARVADETRRASHQVEDAVAGPL